MKHKSVVDVSEISISADRNNGFNYGFTVQYADGEIRNIISASLKDNDLKLLKKLTLERKIYLKQQAGQEKKR